MVTGAPLLGTPPQRGESREGKVEWWEGGGSREEGGGRRGGAPSLHEWCTLHTNTTGQAQANGTMEEGADHVATHRRRHPTRTSLSCPWYLIPVPRRLLAPCRRGGRLSSLLPPPSECCRRHPLTLLTLLLHLIPARCECSGIQGAVEETCLGTCKNRAPWCSSCKGAVDGSMSLEAASSHSSLSTRVCALPIPAYMRDARVCWTHSATGVSAPGSGTGGRHRREVGVEEGHFPLCAPRSCAGLVSVVASCRATT